jgi:single-strand DNA-binding protein
VLNLVVLEGQLSRPAQLVELPSGDRVVTLEVTVPCPGRAAETAPVQWPDPPAWASALDAGAGVVVLGRVRRRFFRAGGVTQSRTEVIAARVVRSSARRRVQALREEAATLLDADLDAGADVGVARA